MAPFVQRIDAGAEPAAVERRIDPSRIARHFAEIVPLAGDPARYPVTQRAESGFRDEQRGDNAPIAAAVNRKAANDVVSAESSATRPRVKASQHRNRIASVSA